MIEFKADCGHIIQTPDHNAGKIVKCAYCGREVEAPRRDDQDPDILFQEVDLNELAKGEGMAGTSGAMTIQGQQKKAKSAPSAEDIARTGNRILRICLIIAFSVICLVVMVMVVRSVPNIAGGPLQKESQIATGTSPVQEPLPRIEHSPAPADTPARVDRARRERQPATASRRGRVNQSFSRNSQGVFVEVFDKSARIYVRERDSQNDATLGADESEFRGRGSTKIALPPGQYRLAICLDISDPELAGLPGFDELRSKLEFEGDARAAKEFFARDVSTEIEFIDEIDVEQRLVRYYDIEVQGNDWTLITNLYVPGDSIRAVLSYLPTISLYKFDRESVRRELSAYGVSVGNLSFVLDMLARAGQVVYPISTSISRVFEIDVREGSFRTRELIIEEDFDIPQDEESVSQPLRQPHRRNPWERGRGQKATPDRSEESAPKDLAAALSVFRQRLNDSETIDPDECRPYFSGGAMHSLWQEADIRTRVAFVELVEKDTAVALLQEIGETMLRDPDLDVRLALLDALVRSGQKKAVSFIDRRLSDLKEDDSIDPGEADREEKALLQAKKKLTKKGGGKRKNPWER